jgi:hypothetical protein
VNNNRGEKKEQQQQQQSQTQAQQVDLDDWSWSAGDIVPTAPTTAAVNPSRPRSSNGTAAARIGPLKINSRSSSSAATTSPSFTENTVAATTDPFAWPPPTATATPSGSTIGGGGGMKKQGGMVQAAAVPINDPLAGLWTSASTKSTGPKQKKPISTTTGPVFDPFDDLALQHSTTTAATSGGAGGGAGTGAVGTQGNNTAAPGASQPLPASLI